MAQRQFRSDDTSVWGDRYGNGSAGTSFVTIYYKSITGTAGNSYLTYGDGWASVPQLIFIHQSNGTGAGNWELNKITSFAGTTANLAYPLCNTYSTGAQMVTLYPYSNLTISDTKTVSAWDGYTGGIFPIMSNRTITISGSIVANGGSGGVGNTGYPAAGTGGGLRGGGADHYNNDGYSGGAGGEIAASNGGKASAYNNNYGKSDGAGGGNATVGGNGTVGNNGFGAGGSVVGNAALTSMFMGGGGGATSGEAGGIWGGGGASGGGIVFILANDIVISGTITSNGGNGVGSGVGSGAGAGGSVLLKGKTVTVGTNKITVTAGTGGSGEGGGNGGTGYIHADYGVTFLNSGGNTPSINTTQDKSLNDIGGSFFWSMV